METQNKNNFANVIGWILITGIVFSIFYFIFLKNVPAPQEKRPESSGQSMENAPVIDDPIERERVRTEDRPSFSSEIENLE